MFLRAHKRLKDGKEHRYWSIVENRRVQGNRVVQRQVLYLGEINDNQRAAWCHTIDIFDEDQDKSTQLVDVHLPTTDGRHLVLPRYTQPNKDQQILLSQLKLNLPDQPPPKTYSKISHATA